MNDNDSALVLAYCASVLGACGYPGYHNSTETVRASFESALRIGRMLDLPPSVIPRLGDSPNDAFLRLSEWLEMRSKRAKVLR